MNPWLRPALFAFAALVALSQPGCRGRIGANCRCAADCREGLVCAAEGEKALAGELCYDAGVIGECIELSEVDTDNEVGGDPTEAPFFPDMWSKRDFLPGHSASDGMTGYATDTDATAGTTGGTSTSSGTTGSSSTGGTSTGDTGADTSTGSTSGTSTGGTSGSTSGTSTGSTSGTTGASTGSTT